MLNFREATINDIPELEALEQLVVEAEKPFNHRIRDTDTRYYDLPKLISSRESCLLVAEAESAIVATGYIQIMQSKPYLKHDAHGYLGFMYVKPSFRGEGLNKTLVDKLIQWGASQGLSDYYLDVYSSNSPAIKAYEKAGFQANLVEMTLHIPQ